MRFPALRGSRARSLMSRTAPAMVLAGAVLVSGQLLEADAAAGRPPALDLLHARLVDLDQPLTRNAPTFPGDPLFRSTLWNCVEPHPELSPRCAEGTGYQLEKITSLGTHTGTHISAPCHFYERIEGRPAACLRDLHQKFFAPRPLVVIDVRRRVARAGHGDFFVELADIRAWERRHGKVPAGAYVVLHTGWSRFYALGNVRRPGVANDYFDPAPGFSLEAARWLLERRKVLGLGSDAFGPDATRDADFSVTAETLRWGAITLENVGPGLARMRRQGDYVTLNGAEYARTAAETRRGLPGFSGTHVGITGYTARR
jgi:kynurenine formamidase